MSLSGDEQIKVTSDYIDQFDIDSQLDRKITNIIANNYGIEYIFITLPPVRSIEHNLPPSIKWIHGNDVPIQPNDFPSLESLVQHEFISDDSVTHLSMTPAA